MIIGKFKIFYGFGAKLVPLVGSVGADPFKDQRRNACRKTTNVRLAKNQLVLKVIGLGSS